MGRALGNNLINMTAYKDVKEALEEGKISSIRYESYKELYEELKQKRRY